MYLQCLAKEELVVLFLLGNRGPIHGLGQRYGEMKLKPFSIGLPESNPWT